MTMDRSELQRLYDRAVGDGRRYWADSHVQNLVTAVGDYLDQDDPTVEIAYLRATIADLKAEPQRVHPSRKDIERTIGLHRVSDPSGGCWTEAWCDCTCGQRIAVPGGTRDEAARRGGQHLAEAVLSLFASQPTVAEVRAQAVREAAAVARLDRVGGLSWIARAVEAWLNARADHIAAAGHEAEGDERR